MTFYVYEFYADSDKDEFLIEWLSDEQIANIAKECDYDFVNVTSQSEWAVKENFCMRRS